MNTQEILLASYFRQRKDHSYDKFNQALQEYRQGQALDYWLSPAQQHQWMSHLIWQLARGVRFIYPGHDLYPDQLSRMMDPPILLSYIGSPIWMAGQGLAIVGSREPSSLGLKWIEESLAKVLEAHNLYTVSGGARGVDQKAHSMSLLAQVPTIVMIPSGLGKIYPSALQDWVPQILKTGGAVVSEYPFLQPMQKRFFQARNRLIAGFSLATLLVEAGLRSGTLITARQCMDQGKPVLVVPSHPLEVRARGGPNLLSEGATLVKDAQDLTVFFEDEVQSLSHFRVMSALARA